MRNLRFVLVLAIVFAFSYLHAQSLGEIARQQKQKKQGNAATSPGSTAPTPLPAHGKVYTNNDISLTRNEPSTNATAQNTATKDSGNQVATKDAGSSGRCGEGASPAPSSKGMEINMSVPASIKRPAGFQVDGGLRNTSSDFLHLTETDIFTGPCNYHREQSSGLDIGAGSGWYTNFLSFTALDDACPGMYKLEVRLCSGGQLLRAATYPFRVE